MTVTRKGAVVLSNLFAGDQLLESIAQDIGGERISGSQHANDPAVGKVQAALLIWDPACLPQFGADGQYGTESAGAVHRFKAEELDVPEAEIIDDVGPRTVVRLDEIAAVAEGLSAPGVVVVASPGATDDQLAGVWASVEQAGGAVLTGLGPLAAIVTSDQATLGVVTGLVGSVLDAVLTPQSPGPPAGVDPDTAQLIAAWITMLDPAYLLKKADPSRLGGSFAELNGCAAGVA